MRIVCGIVFTFLLFVLYWILSEKGVLEIIMDRAVLQEYIARLGPLGPLTVIGMMAGAIVFSPLPSAPVALASGVAFGHTWGTVYIMVGAEIGALVAFTIARLLGYEILHKWFGERLTSNVLGNQNTLMTVVFVSRLIPFVSFDVVSYAAGLTSLALWRFALATLFGLIPASFLLAHFGMEVASADIKRIMVSAIAIGGITLFPVAIKAMKRLRSKN
jgi:uncharacterized membrane protein YdjX (TVP38/TMEM64 family)